MKLEERPFFKSRNDWLSADFEDFSKYCKIENFQDSGKGGQKRNRKYSAVRLTHIETGISSECALYREQNINRKKAVQKLKLKLALLASGDQIISVRNITSLESSEYPLWAAFVFDEFYKNDFELEEPAEKLSLSKTKLLKLIFRDRDLWKEVNRNRLKLGKYQWSCGG